MDTQKNQPAYFAIIPANVRYSAIPDRAKLLFGEITALAQKEGYCFASNSYFAEAYQCSPQAISKHISALENAGFLRIEHNQSSGNLRKIWPLMDVAPYQPAVDTYQPAVDTYQPAVDTYQPQVETPINQKLRPYQPQVKHIKTSIKEQDIKDTNAVFDENDPEYLVTVVGIESAKEKETEVSPVVEIISYLNEKVGAKYRATTKDYITSINARLKEDYTVADFKQVIDFKAAQWSNDPKMSEYLRPSTLFIRKHFDEYLNAPKITASRANTNDALKDCTLPADIAPRYEAYFNHALQTYPALLESATKVFSHCDYLDYWNNTSTPGLPFSLTPSDKRRVMLTVHEQLNANKYLREKYSSVFAAYLVAVKQSMKQETIKL